MTPVSPQRSRLPALGLGPIGRWLGVAPNGAVDDAAILRRTRVRLMAVSGFVTLLILVVLGFAIYEAVATRFASSDQQQLMGFATEHRRNGPPESASALEVAGENAGLFFIGVAPDGVSPPPGFPRVAAQGGVTLPAGLPDLRAVAAAASSTDGTDFRRIVAKDGATYDIYTISKQTVGLNNPGVGRAIVTGWTLQFVANRNAETSLLATLRLILLGGGIAALLASLLAGYLYAGRALVPIRASMARREEALRRQREFTANASHELRTPLTVIRASVTDLMRNRRARVEEVGEALGDIDAEVNHLTALVDDLLLLARTDSGVVQIEHVPVDVGDVAVEAVSMLSPLASARDVRVEVEPLPAEAMGDPLRLRQLVTILVDNAIRHSPPATTVSVRVRPDAGTALLTVEDQGPGIRPEDMPKVFERFWRADNAPAGGTGLGLAIGRWIVEQHRGSIGVANRPEGGAVFWARIPLAEPGAGESLDDIEPLGTIVDVDETVWRPVAPETDTAPEPALGDEATAGESIREPARTER